MYLDTHSVPGSYYCDACASTATNVLYRILTAEMVNLALFILSSFIANEKQLN